MMLGDELEAARLVVQRMKTAPPEEVYDEMLLPALSFTRRDVRRDYLTDEDQRMILKGMRESLRHTDEFLRTAAASASQQEQLALAPEVRHAISGPTTEPVKILGCPAKDDTDCVGLEMLRQLLDPTHWNLEVTSLETLTSELAARVAETPPAIICIASLPPGGQTHARYLCKRLRAASPDIEIVVGRWGLQRHSKLDSERLEQAGASFVTTTLLETRRLLESRLPLLTRMIPAASVSAVSEHVSSSSLVMNVPNA